MLFGCCRFRQDADLRFDYFAIAGYAMLLTLLACLLSAIIAAA